MGVLFLMNKSGQSFFRDVIREKVVVAAFHRIEATLFDLLIDS